MIEDARTAPLPGVESLHLEGRIGPLGRPPCRPVPSTARESDTRARALRLGVPRRLGSAWLYGYTRRSVSPPISNTVAERAASSDRAGLCGGYPPLGVAGTGGLQRARSGRWRAPRWRGDGRHSYVCRIGNPGALQRSTRDRGPGAAPARRTAPPHPAQRRNTATPGQGRQRWNSAAAPGCRAGGCCTVAGDSGGRGVPACVDGVACVADSGADYGRRPGTWQSGRLESDPRSDNTTLWRGRIGAVCRHPCTLLPPLAGPRNAGDASTRHY